MAFHFPTPLHRLGAKHYNHLPTCHDAVNFMLNRIDERQAGILKQIYINETQFTRYIRIKEIWNEWYPMPEDQLSGDQINMLIFLLNMHGCEIAHQRRVKELKRGPR